MLRQWGIDAIGGERRDTSGLAGISRERLGAPDCRTGDCVATGIRQVIEATG